MPLVVGAVTLAWATARGGEGTRAPALALGVALAAVLVARRSAPGSTLVGTGALFLLLVHVDSGAAPAGVLAPALALFTLALARGRGHQLLAALGAVAAVIVAGTMHQRNPGLAETFGHVALVGLPLLIAETVRTRRSYVAVLRERLELAERTREQEARRRVEQERMRIARELHDVVAHTLSAINVQAAVAGHLLERDPEHARDALAGIEDASRDAIGELRAILGVLRDPDHPEHSPTPTPGLDDLGELVEQARAAGLDISVHTRGDRTARVADSVSLAAYRIVQESLTNARRHAAGSPVRVRITFRADQLDVVVDTVAGSALNGHPAGAGVGIRGMIERAEAVGGSLRAGAKPNGFRVEAHLPNTPVAQ